jgi:hypothetical protein
LARRDLLTDVATVEAMLQLLFVFVVLGVPPRPADIDGALDRARADGGAEPERIDGAARLTVKPPY